MGQLVDPSLLTESGERCLQRLCELDSLGLPAPQLITAVGTAVEAHTSRILEGLVELSEVHLSPLGRALLDEVEGKMDDTWASRAQWLKTPFQIQYKGTKASQDLDVLIDARNAIVHGDESLTKRQVRDLNKLISLTKALQKELYIRVRQQLGFTPKTARSAVEIARAFVKHFDAIVIREHPAAYAL